MVHFKIIFQHLSGMTKADQTQFRLAGLQQNLESEISGIRNSDAKLYITTLGRILPFRKRNINLNSESNSSLSSVTGIGRVLSQL